MCDIRASEDRRGEHASSYVEEKALFRDASDRFQIDIEVYGHDSLASIILIELLSVRNLVSDIQLSVLKLEGSYPYSEFHGQENLQP